MILGIEGPHTMEELTAGYRYKMKVDLVYLSRYLCSWPILPTEIRFSTCTTYSFKKKHSQSSQKIRQSYMIFISDISHILTVKFDHIQCSIVFILLNCFYSEGFAFWRRLNQTKLSEIPDKNNGKLRQGLLCRWSIILTWPFQHFMRF